MSCFFLVAARVPLTGFGFWQLDFDVFIGRISEFVLLGFHGALQICRLFFINFGKFSAFTPSQTLPFLGLLSFWNSYYVHNGIMMVSHRSVFDFLCFPFCSLGGIFQLTLLRICLLFLLPKTPFCTSL